MRVLLVGDDRQTSDFIIKGLNQEDFVVDYAAADSRDGHHLAVTTQYDVAIVDTMLPHINGLTLIELLRRAKVATPVLVLSAKNSVGDRVNGLQKGSDIYMVKPFVFAELVARLRALVHRHGDEPAAKTLRAGQLWLDLHRRRAYMGQSELLLQPKELMMLEFLLRNQGRVVCKTMIIDHVWDFNFDPQTNVVESKISKLRSKLAAASSGTPYIYSVRDLGYVCEHRGGHAAD